jgi:phytoene synthase
LTDYSHSRRIASQSGSNFYLSFFFLPKEKRNGILAIYAFSRLVDDAVDEASDTQTAEEQIQLWRKRLHFCFNGSSNRDGDKEVDHPLLAELRDTIQRFRIPKKYFMDLLTGVEMDLAKKRYESFSELETYCYHVAGTIGLLCNCLFGMKEEEAERYAVLLGTAFQLTNIIRDVGSDLKRGRLYLPRKELAEFGVVESDLLEERVSESFYQLMRFQADRAEEYFEKAFGTLPEEKRKKLVPAEIMSGIYRRILRKLQKENFPVFERKVSLSKTEKLGLVLKIFLRSKL